MLQFFEKKKRQKLTIFDAGHVESDIIKQFASFSQHFVLLPPKKREKHAFLLKKGLTSSYL